MGRRGISQQVIYDAAQRIAATGKFPTTQSIRAMLGTGSSSTIHKHLLAWKKERLINNASQMDLGEYSKWLFNLEKENLDLKYQISSMQVEVNKLKLENSQLKRIAKLGIMQNLAKLGRAILSPLTVKNHLRN